MCPLLGLGLPRAFLQQPITVITRKTRQADCAINQSIFNMMSMNYHIFNIGLLAKKIV